MQRNGTRSVRARLAAAAVVGVIGCALAARCAWSGRVVLVGPVLLVVTTSDRKSTEDALVRAGVAGEARDVTDARAAQVALGALSPDDAQNVRALLEDLNARLELRKNPLVEDLGDGEPEKPLLALARVLKPVITASNGIAARTHVADDGALGVAVGMTCGPPGDATCLSPWADAAPKSAEARARFHAWPIAASVLLAFPSAETARSERDRLRVRIAASPSKVALVLGEKDLEGEHDAVIDGVRLQAQRALEIVGDRAFDGRALLEQMARSAPPGRRIPWLALKPAQLLVVPRLSALAELSAFVAEVRALATSAEWVHAPPPL